MANRKNIQAKMSRGWLGMFCNCCEVKTSTFGRKRRNNFRQIRNPKKSLRNHKGN